ncbi:MAG TPA: hypothetical protein GXX28_04345, partial [Firmicutes bacterium]|nr:hypothetical protein [Bacillota bacterium]
AGGVTAAALAELGAPLPLEVAGRPCRAIRPRYGRNAVTVRRETPLVQVVRRDRFDAYLLSLAHRAGAEVRHGVRVTEVEPHPDQVVIRSPRGTWRARVVIGADGAQSRVGLAVRPRFTRGDVGVCLVGELPGPPEAWEPFLSDGLEVCYNTPAKGYGWLFPQEAALNVGIGSVAPRLASPRRELSRFLALAGLPEPEHVRGAVLPLGGRNHPAQAGRIMLAGDALGVADPFTGEGIRYALASGRIAGECAAAALRRSLTQPDLTAYPLRWREAFGDDLRCARLLARLYLALDQRLNALVFRHPGLFERVADILAGKGTYRQLVGELGRRLPGYWLRGLLTYLTPFRAGIRSEETATARRQGKG